MRKLIATLVSNLSLTTALVVPSLASAQDAATPAPAPTPAAAPATPEPAPPAAAAAPQATASPQAPSIAAGATTPAPTAPEPPKEAEKPVPSYFRLDHDYMFGLQLWAGATYPLTSTLGIATDIYVAENYPGVSLQTDPTTGAPVGAGIAQSYWGEFDIGPALTLGPVSLTPMAGIAFDWAAKRAVAMNAPQLYTIVNLDKFYFESWVWTVLYSAFNKAGPNDYVHTRNWFLYKINSTIAVGPQLEYSYDIEAKRTAFGFPIGGHVELAYGAGNSLGLFVGYDTKKATHGTDDTAAVGRLTFVHNF